MFGLAMGAVLAQSLAAVVELGVVDLLADGPRPVSELGSETGTVGDSLNRMLRPLSTAGYFDRDGETYALNDVSRTLLSGHPAAGREVVLALLSPTFVDSYQRLAATARTGITGTDLAVGVPIFEHFARNPEEGTTFNRAMLGIHGPEAAAVSAAWDLPGARLIVDVGGGIGTLLRTVVEAVPGSRGILFDRPEVVAQADLSATEDRISAEGGDFFEAVPAGGDVYLLSHIVHDWSDETAREILVRCRDAMAPDGRVVLIEMVLPSDNQDHPSLLIDVIMLSVAGGRERTPEQYRELFASAGLELERIVATSSAVSLIEGRRRDA
ncbi:methyltransferase [Micromonospora sp. NPDC049230]|uniref:methyltransferase n=1 Tax=Micromonospora sp. NPDC049230 TaxID=3155502 RepID=UPI00340336AB